MAKINVPLLVITVLVGILGVLINWQDIGIIPNAAPGLDAEADGRYLTAFRLYGNKTIELDNTELTYTVEVEGPCQASFKINGVSGKQKNSGYLGRCQTHAKVEVSGHNNFVYVKYENRKIFHWLNLRVIADGQFDVNIPGRLPTWKEVVLALAMVALLPLACTAISLADN